MENTKGKFIAIYGINNIGKTTQAALLKKHLEKIGRQAEIIRYPLYDFLPAGQLINEYLRSGNPYKFTPREFQLLNFINQIASAPQLAEKLDQGIDIIADEYFGTAIAWGVCLGVEEKLLDYFYQFLPSENLAILLEGERFRESIENSHRYETDESLIQKAQNTHLRIAEKYKWQPINANQSIEQVHAGIWKLTEKIL